MYLTKPLIRPGCSRQKNGQFGRYLVSLVKNQLNPDEGQGLGSLPAGGGDNNLELLNHLLLSLLLVTRFTSPESSAGAVQNLLPLLGKSQSWV